MTIQIPIKNLKQHPAQMRTVYDIESLATLCLQIYERGLDEWQPVLAAPNGEEGSYFIVSGHRRQMARLLAWALADWAADHPDKEIGIEVAHTMIVALVESLGSLPHVISALLEKYGDQEIPIVLFAGSQKAEILSLQAANYGSEQADMLGIAHSFQQALEAGATEAEIARNAGQKLAYVRNHLALTQLPPELAQRIAAGELPMGVGTAVADLPDAKRTGLSVFILANLSAGSRQAPSTSSGQVLSAPSANSGRGGNLTAKAVKTCAAVLKKWNGLQMPLTFKHQSQRNIARALIRLWSQVVEAYPEDAYAAASMLIFRKVHEAPWASKEKLTLWFQALGGDTYYTDGHFDKLRAGGINWTAVVQYLVTEVACETCPINQLPKTPLRSDLSQGQGGPLGMPCRVGETGPRCIHGLAANDPVDVRVPWEWSEHPGVEKEGSDYRVKSVETLLTAWEAQAVREKGEAKAEGKKQKAEVVAGDRSQAVGTDTSMPATSDQPPATSDPLPAAASPSPPKESPIVKQRAVIADFMKTHEQLSACHPFATPCGSCRHRLDKSPTKDEAVPHCAWAGRLRGVEYKRLTSALEGAPEIPVCRQFAPNQPWPERIPAHPEPSGLPRDWVKAQILHLVKAANQYGSKRNAFEFLTGRPMSANETHGDWFARQLDEQIGELSDAQMFTLFVWAHSEWQRAGSGRLFSLPLNSKGIQFADYSEQAWQIGQES